MLKKIDYGERQEDYKYQLKTSFEAKDYKQVKKILLQALRYDYLDFSIQEIDLRKSKGKDRLIELINEFNLISNIIGSIFTALRFGFLATNLGR